MAPYPKKLTKAAFLRKNPGGNYQAYLRSYVKNKAARQAKQPAFNPFASLLAPGPALPSLDPSAFMGQAQQIAQAQLAPQLAMLQAEAAAAQQASQAQIRQVGGLSQAAGQMAQSIAPNIQRAYSGAAEAQANFAKGFSDGMRDLAQQDAASNSAFLGQQGAPQAQIDQVAGVGQGGADAMYAASGYIPASTMVREGADYTAWANQMPAVFSRLGQQDAQALAADAARQRAGISSQIASASASLPGLVQEALSGLQGQAFDQYQLQRQAFEADREWKLQILATQLANAAARGEKGAAAAQQKFENALALGIDPTTGQPLRAASTSGGGGGGGGASSPAPTSTPNTARGNRVAYRKSINKAIPDLYGKVLEQTNATRKKAWESGGSSGNRYVGPSTPTGKYVERKPSYSQASALIYAALLKDYKGPKGRWRYGLTGAKVNAMIRAFLKKQGIRQVPAGARPGP